MLFRSKRLPVVDPLDWPSAVIVAAHPDDEILGAGGTLARLAAGGARLRLVAVTDGEASHPGTDPRDTARRRTAESADALRLLGVDPVRVKELAFALSIATIGITTAVLCSVGLLVGRRAGAMFGRRLDALGGLLLIGIGTMILVEHLGTR